MGRWLWTPAPRAATGGSPPPTEVTPGTALEADAATPVPRVKTRTITPATETDAAGAAARR